MYTDCCLPPVLTPHPPTQADPTAVVLIGYIYIYPGDATTVKPTNTCIYRQYSKCRCIRYTLPATTRQTYVTGLLYLQTELEVQVSQQYVSIPRVLSSTQPPFGRGHACVVHTGQGRRSGCRTISGTTAGDRAGGIRSLGATPRRNAIRPGKTRTPTRYENKNTP